MGKKVFSLCMALALCLGLLPVTALAEDAPGNLYVGNQVCRSETSCWTTNSETGELTEYKVGGNDWNVKYDPSTATLTLKNATIKTTNTFRQDAVIYAQSFESSAVSLTINLEGTNKIECDTASYGIYVNAEMSDDSYGTNASLTITGTGSLAVSGSTHGIWVKSGSGNASLNINDASVVAKTTQTYSGCAGVYVQSSVHATSSPQLSLAVNGGSLTASGTGSSDGISFYVGSSNATGATTSLTVSENAIVDARNGGISASRILVTLPTPTPTGNNSSGIVFDGSAGTVYGSVTLQDDLEIKSGETLTVPEGSTLNTNNNLTNNGTIVNTGGTLNGKPDGTGKIETTPTIDTQPASQTVTVGQTASFTVTATGENLSYQWQQITDNGQSWTDIDGATDATYTAEATTTSMSGYQYHCVVSNSAGSVTSSAATLTVTQPVTGVSLNKDSLNLYVGGNETLTATVEPANATNQNVTWSSDKPEVATVENGKVTAKAAGKATITVTTEDGEKTATCTVTVEKPYTPPPYIPPTKTPSEQAIDKIEDAKEGSTVKITLRTGQTKLDKEVFEELAGRDVTLEISLPGGVTWTVNGEDIPKTSDLTDLDMGVSLNTSTIPVDLINAITGEIGTVQLTLKHDGPFGFTMTLTAPVGKENEGLWANLYHYDEDAGEMVYQTAAQVDEDGNVALPFDHASQYALVLDSKSHDLPFTDLAANAWYTDAVAYVYRHDIMEGMSATTFQPNGTLSRAMAVQIFYNLEGQPDISGENLGYPYEDVNAQAWYGDAVYWARITGVATGYGDGTFQPGDSITRQEFAQMLYNYAKYKGYDLTAEGDLSQFPDSGSVADWAEIAMSWANGNKLINGHDDGTIDAAGTATRAQAASILMRFDQNLVEK